MSCALLSQCVRSFGSYITVDRIRCGHTLRHRRCDAKRIARRCPLPSDRSGHRPCRGGDHRDSRAPDHSVDYRSDPLPVSCPWSGLQRERPGSHRFARLAGRRRRAVIRLGIGGIRGGGGRAPGPRSCYPPVAFAGAPLGRAEGSASGGIRQIRGGRRANPARARARGSGTVSSRAPLAQLVELVTFNH